MAQATTFTGSITDMQGNPVTGAKILLASTGTATSTGNDGTVSISTQAAPTTGVQDSRKSPTKRIGHILLESGRIRIRFDGASVDGRGAALDRSQQGTSSPVAARPSATSDTLLISWNGSIRFRGALDSLLAVPNAVIRIDTAPQKTDVPWNKASTGTLLDERDGQLYRTVKIGTQTWMAENLNYRIDSSWWYQGKAENGALYGRLYTWAGAMNIDHVYDSTEYSQATGRIRGICPAGWHIPSTAEWDTLINFVGSDSAQIALHCASCRWTVDTASFSGLPFPIPTAITGHDSFGFRMLPAGFKVLKGYIYLEKFTGFWNSEETGSETTRSTLSDASEGTFSLSSENSKNIGLSLRCLQN